MKNTDKNFIPYGEFLKRKFIREMLEEQEQLIYKKNILKISLGVGCLIVAVIPNGLGFIFYPLGIMLVVNGGIDLIDYYKKIKNKILNKLRLMRWIK